MVRVNLVDPTVLADQHLIAEYNEILMLAGHVEKHPEIKKQPERYKLGKGHINFFKDKLVYLKKRHELLKKEMRIRGFQTNMTLDISKNPIDYRKDWKPEKKDFGIIKVRILEKIKMKSGYYRYYSEKKDFEFFQKLMRKV